MPASPRREAAGTALTAQRRLEEIEVKTRVCMGVCRPWYVWLGWSGPCHVYIHAHTCCVPAAILAQGAQQRVLPCFSPSRPTLNPKKGSGLGGGPVAIVPAPGTCNRRRGGSTGTLVEAQCTKTPLLPPPMSKTWSKGDPYTLVEGRALHSR